MNVTKSSVLGSLFLSAVAVIALAAMRPTPASASTPPQASSSATFAAVDVPAPTPVVTLPEVTVTVPKAIKKPAKAKQYKCGAFERLETDAVQQVRRCEWR